tara:strand:+ start:491 stop:1345 length:855 start_codon:yes stop_codon:yes gene_type:complete
MGDMENRGYLKLYKHPPYMTCIIIALWCIVQSFRNPTFPDYQDDSFCFSSYRPFKTVFTYAFSHTDMLHITFNSISMFFLGGFLEAVEGPFILLCIFASSVPMGACYYALWKPKYLVRGASGGCYGIMAAHISTMIMNWSEMPLRWFRLFICTTVVGSEIIGRYFYRNPTIGYAVHFGGAIGGVTTAIIFVRNINVRCHEITLLCMSTFVYFGSIIYVLLDGWWKPALGASIVGTPLVLQVIMTLKLYDYDDTHLEEDNSIFKISSWKKLFKKKNKSILPENNF